MLLTYKYVHKVTDLFMHWEMRSLTYLYIGKLCYWPIYTMGNSATDLIIVGNEVTDLVMNKEISHWSS
jgi:hypothetical protein